jgi:hypothetical protein
MAYKRRLLINGRTRVVIGRLIVMARFSHCFHSFSCLRRRRQHLPSLKAKVSHSLLYEVNLLGHWRVYFRPEAHLAGSVIG